MKSADIIHRARALVLEAGQVLPGVSGRERREWVIDQLVSEIDRAAVWPHTPAGQVAEHLDGEVARVLVEGIVHLAWESWRASRKQTGI